MKKKIALFLCMILTVLPFAAVTAAAAEYTADNDSQYIMIAQQWVQGYTSFPVEQIEEYLAAGAITGDQAETMRSWAEIAETVGEQPQPGEGTVQLQGEDVKVTVPVTGESGMAYFVAVFDGNLSIDQLLQTGEMKSARFTLTPDEDSGSLGTKLKNAALNTLMGIVSVFLILVIIIFVISLLKYVPMLAEKLSGKNRETESPVPVSTPTPANEAVSGAVPQTDDGVLAAVIAAAAAAAMSEETGMAVTTDQLIVRSIKRAAKR